MKIVSAYSYKVMKSPVGDLTLVASDKGLAAILWKGDSPKRVRLSTTAMREDKKHPVLAQAESELKEYFAGTRTRFTVELDFVSGTEFQKKVWKALLAIPFGKTVSYGQIAAQIGKPKAARAVGSANNKNPISIIAACHRVIGSSGKLTGYAGGMKNKALLLKLEGAR